MEWRHQLLYQPLKVNYDTKPKPTFMPIRSSRGQTRSASCNPSQVAVVQLTTEKTNKLLKTNQILTIGTMNVQKLQKLGKMYELITSAETTKQDIICIQDHRYIHDETPIREQRFENWIILTCSAWRNSINASNGGIGMLVNQSTYNTISGIEMITPRIMVTSFQ